MRPRYWEFEQEVSEAVRVGLIVIGGIVREARRRRGLTQRQLAWSSTLSQSTISRLETGRLRGMRLFTLAAIIGVLRTNPDGSNSPAWETLTGADDNEPPRSHRRLPRQKDLEKRAA